MPYTVRLAPAADRRLKKLGVDDRRRLALVIDRLAEDPRPAGCRKLAGHESIYRMRIGDLRIVYQVNDRDLIVLVAMIGNRRDVYRDLERLLPR